MHRSSVHAHYQPRGAEQCRDAAQSIGGLKGLCCNTGPLQFGREGKTAFAISGTSRQNKIRRDARMLETASEVDPAIVGPFAKCVFSPGRPAVKDGGILPSRIERRGPDSRAQIKSMGGLSTECHHHRAEILGLMTISAMFDGQVIVGVTMLAGPAKSRNESCSATGGQESSDSLPAGKIDDHIKALAAHSRYTCPGMGETELDNFLYGRE